jgi:hypothetical protein
MPKRPRSRARLPWAFSAHWAIPNLPLMLVGPGIHGTTAVGETSGPQLPPWGPRSGGRRRLSDVSHGCAVARSGRPTTPGAPSGVPCPPGHIKALHQQHAPAQADLPAQIPRPTSLRLWPRTLVGTSPPAGAPHAFQYVNQGALGTFWARPGGSIGEKSVGATGFEPAT